MFVLLSIWIVLIVFESAILLGTEARDSSTKTKTGKWPPLGTSNTSECAAHLHHCDNEIPCCHLLVCIIQHMMPNYCFSVGNQSAGLTSSPRLLPWVVTLAAVIASTLMIIKCELV